MKKEKLTKRIIQVLSETSEPLNLNQISKILMLKSDSDEYFLFRDVLFELCDNKIIQKHARRRYSLPITDKFSEVEGKLRIDNNRGIVETKLPNITKIIIKQKDLGTAFDGDIVKVQLLAQKKGKKTKGVVTEVVKRNNREIVGKLEKTDYFWYLVPEDLNYYVDFLIPENKLGSAKAGDKVSARFISWTDPQTSPSAEVLSIIGKSGIPNVEYDSVLHEFDLPFEFPQIVIDEALKFKKPQNRKPAGRLDLRNEDIITIDPVDARDFDDALSLKILESGNYQLGVHIADVSHYVAENSELDIEARFRGNSIYLVDRVIPMLPEELSNVICSLQPNEPRLAFSVFMEITPRGILKEYSLAETIIKSKRRFTYEEVLDIIHTGVGDYSELIQKLHILAKILKKKRYSQGGIEFETSEIKFKLDENKFPIEIMQKTTTDSTSLVEECMLMANQAVAMQLKKISKELKAPTDLPFLFRIHDEPDKKKISEALEFLSELGVKSQKKNLSSKEINALLNQANKLPEKNIIHQILIRAMAKAVYSAGNIGHYGLGFKEYSHFTSPIRRYPDLVVHRLLKEYSKGMPERDRLSYLKIFVKDAANHTSNTERLAMDAERASIKLTQTVMASNLVGDEFDATISGVQSYGVFAVLDGFFGEGLLHIKDMTDDYYIYEENKFRLIGRRNKRIFHFGKKIRVKIIKVNINKRTIDLRLVE